MKSIDFKSFVIGILSSVILFLLIGSDKKMNDLGNITVDQITIRKGLQILNKNDEKAVSIYNSKGGGGVLKLYNKFGKNTAYLGTGGGDKGGFKIYNKDGDEIAFMSSTKSNKGFLRIYNSNSKPAAVLSADENDAGLLTMKDQDEKEIFNSNNINASSSIDLSNDELTLGNLKVKSLALINDEGSIRGSFNINENNDAEISLSVSDQNIKLPDSGENKASININDNLGDITVNSISIFDNDEKLKLKIGVDEENSGFLQVTNEVEDYFYPSGLADIDLVNFDDITVKSVTVKDKENNKRAFLGLSDKNDGILSLKSENQDFLYPAVDSLKNIDNSNLGDIIVNSIKVLNKDNIPTALLGSTSKGNGKLQITDATGKNVIFSSTNSLQKNNNLGDISVNSINVINEENESILTLNEHKAGYGVILAKNPVGDVVFSSDQVATDTLSVDNDQLQGSLFDDIQVKSLTVVNDNGQKIGYFGKNDIDKPELRLYNTFQDVSLSMSTSSNDGGNIKIYDSMSNTIFDFDDETKNLTTESINVSKLSSKQISSESINTKEANIRSLDVADIKTNKIAINNIAGDNKILIGIDDVDRGIIKTYLPDNSLDFNSTKTSSSSELDNIKAKSITITNSDGDNRIYIGTDENKNGYINIENEFGISTNRIETDIDGNGKYVLSNHTGQNIISLNRGEGDGGIISLFNRNNENIAQIGIDQTGKTGKISRINQLEIMNQFEYVTSILGNDSDGQGSLSIANQDGILSTTLGTLSTGKGGGLITYNVDGKITSFLGTNDNNGGILMSFNKHAKRTTYLGTNKNDFGMILLSSKGGVVRWGKEGNE